MSDVLVAESSRTLATLIRLTLTPVGYRLRFVTSGRQALRSAVSEPTDLVIVDAGLSDMSGYEVAEALRGDPATARIPLLLTHHDYDPPDRARIARAGIQDVLTKPFERQALVERARALVAPRAAAPATTPDSDRAERARPAPVVIEAAGSDALKAAVDAAVERAMAEIAPRLDALLADRLQQALDTEVRQLVKSKAESIVWKAVGELAEDLIREEITRLTQTDPE